MEAKALETKKATATLSVNELRKENERGEYEQYRLEAKQQHAERDRVKFVDAVNRVQSDVGHLQEPIKNDSADLQKHMEDH